MQLKLRYLDINLTNVPKEHLLLLEEMFSKDTCQPLMEYTKIGGENSSALKYFYAETYNFAFEYAISCDARAFIEDLISHGEIIPYIDNNTLYEYAKKYSSDFLILALETMVNHTSILQADAISQKFWVSAREIFIQTPSTSFSYDEENEDRYNVNTIFNNKHEESEFLVKTILTSAKITPEKKEPFFEEWLNAYHDKLNRSKNKERVRLIFFKYLSRRQQDLLQILKASISKEVGFRETFEFFLNQHSFASDQLASLLDDSLIFDWQPYHLIALIQRLDFNDTKYANYKLLLKLLELDPSKRPIFILKNQILLSDNFLPKNVLASIVDLIRQDHGEFFIEWYIDHQDFEYGPLLISNLLKYDENVICRYLSAPHVQIPHKFLTHLIYQKTELKDPDEIISLLIKHPNYRFMIDDLFNPLLVLFRIGAKNSVAVLLNHPSVFNLLKQYHALNGDDKLPSEYRECLMPSVIAWYIAESNQYNEIFFSIPDIKRKEVLTGCVSLLIDPSQPTLQSFIIQSGIPELIEVIGGIYPRLIGSYESSKSVAFMPGLWRNPKTLETLRKIQKKSSIEFAEKQSQILSYAKPPDEQLKIYAQQAAKACKTNILYLQHQTLLENANSAISDSYLKSRQHIQGINVSGKASQGLTRPNAPLEGPHNLFTFFTRIADIDDNCRTTHFMNTPQGKQARFVINGMQLLAENPHINFIVIGFYPHFNVKELELPGGHVLVSKASQLSEAVHMMKIRFNTYDEILPAINQRLFEIIFKKFIKRLHEPLKSTMIRVLTQPASDEDQNLIYNLFNLLHLEWLLPGDIPLKISYVEQLELGEKTYLLSALRKIATESEEPEIIAAIDTFKDALQFPFVLDGMLAIAIKRKHKEVVNNLIQLQHSMQFKDNIIYYPNEVYEIESLAQLLLEDLNNDRIYLRYSNDSIVIKSTLKMNSNRDGAHHAEMPKLHYALGIGEMQGKNALTMTLDDNLTLAFGEYAEFKSLSTIRDVLLTYEITTLLTSQQNLNYYVTHNGSFHPDTGKGATNGRVALLPERLFMENMRYQIKVNCDDNKKQILIDADNETLLSHIASTISNVLNFSNQEIYVKENKVVLNITPHKLIAKLRQKAIFYEGINVITEDGRLLLAERHNRGLASAGGHHSDKYCDKGIAYGLYSEFGLIFKDPQNMNQTVQLLSKVKTISKTGIYIVLYESLVPTKTAIQYAYEQHKDIAFLADPDEFSQGSEVALTLTQMRGKQFYDVMPLSGLCQYYLNELKQYLNEHFTQVYNEMTLSIDDSIDMVIGPTTVYKVPSSSFGCMTVSFNSKSTELIESVFAEHALLSEEQSASKRIYQIEESPFVILQKLKDLIQCASSRAYCSQ